MDLSLYMDLYIYIYNCFGLILHLTSDGDASSATRSWGLTPSAAASGPDEAIYLSIYIYLSIHLCTYF